MNKAMPFPEDFLHYIWQQMAFDLKDLKTTDNQTIIIAKTGEHNSNAGPDFSEAKIYIGDLLWIGDVEIHIQSQEWLQHEHQFDKNYEKVILHVVYEDNAPIYYKDGKSIPTLVLKNRIDPNLLAVYLHFLEHPNILPCQAHLPEILYRTNMGSWLHTLGRERLQLKSENLKNKLQACQDDWSTLLFWQLMQAMGGDVNKEAMLTLAQSLPLQIIAKHKNNLFELEALLFGQASLLPAHTENAYLLKLKSTYQFLKHKYQLENIDARHWKFSKMRPANFPTIRIAQMAQLLYQSEHLFAKILQAENLQVCKELFYIQLHPFWNNHYTLDKESTTTQIKRLGNSAIELILINTIIPLLYTYATLRAQQDLYYKIDLWLSQIPAEKNHILDLWKDLGAQIKNALEAQAFLHLYKNYCTSKRCLSCKIGQNIFSENIQQQNPL